jgi:hypothetical protein
MGNSISMICPKHEESTLDERQNPKGNIHDGGYAGEKGK